MGDLTKLINSELKRIIKRIKVEFEPTKSYQGKGCKRRKISPPENESYILNSTSDFPGKVPEGKISVSDDKRYDANLKEEPGRYDINGLYIPRPERSFSEQKLDLRSTNDLGNETLSTWEALALSDILEGFYTGWENEEYIIKNHVLLHSIWQRLHTGHWSEVPLGLRTAFTWGSINLVGLLLRKLLEGLERRTDSPECLQTKALRIVQACDRGLLMGRPVEDNPLPEVAALLNGAAMGILNDGEVPIYDTVPDPLPIPTDTVPDEAVPFKCMTPLENQRLPHLQQFLLTRMKGQRPLKISGLAESWPAISKWDFNYLRRVAGARTVPVEVGLRYSDSNWSQTLMTLDHYFSAYLGSAEGTPPASGRQRAYLAQHQLCDQIPELLSDIMVPDYCRMGERDPVVNVWVGPEGTVTPLHHDPDHNILVQVHGYKTLLIFPESDSKSLYAFEDDLLSNTSRVNLEEEVKLKNMFETWPLLKEVQGHYVTLGPGDAVYLPPKWWHYVRSLSNSISVSFWWR
ncbi:UNVERIFIED_CONTAM: hypothetical protein GTU68_034441 [Idotea baltica]|nr:hypothetical protein [Idotea baltica]MCL4119281.1 hypothetical protein [Idotea baltica]